MAFKEPGFEKLFEKIAVSETVLIGAPTVVECSIVVARRIQENSRLIVQDALRKSKAQIVAFTEEHYHCAIEAFLRFGKGRHPAGLNFGDCMSYAVAAVAGLPLLFTGSDFARTDIPAA